MTRASSNPGRRIGWRVAGIAGFALGLTLQAPNAWSLIDQGFPFYGKWLLVWSWVVLGFVFDTIALVLWLALGRRSIIGALGGALLPTVGYVIALPISVFVAGFIHSTFQIG